MGAPVAEVELADRRATEPVDHERDPVARLEREVGDDGLEQLVDDLVRRGELLAAATRLTVDADAHLHLVVGQVEERRTLGRRRAGRQCHAHGPGDAVDLLADADQLVEVGTLLGRRTDRLHHEEVARDTTSADGVGRVLDGDVVVDEQRLALMSSASASSCAMSNAIRSPV